ncbi:MAG TPA: nucleotide sugar dehydrogenase, partial [Chloroflexota bacterium]|nr:nucleotide sugar dehydrogenase [Chloroflexota bacterium]
LVAGATPRCLEVATALYAAIVDRVVPVSSLKTAEMAKLVENAFRMVNVGFANEVALWCDQLGLDVWEVIDAAATKPFGFMAHYPGPGLGGHCIPVDPYYLVWKLKTLDYPARFIELAGEINRAMPPFVVSKVQGALERHGRPLRGSRVLVLGAAYKRDVADVRESPSLDVIGLLVEHGALVEYHDPHVPSVTVRLSERALAHADELPAAKETVLRLESVDLWPAVEHADCVVVCTDHSAYEWETLARRARLIVDTRNAMRGVALTPADAEVVKL